MRLTNVLYASDPKLVYTSPDMAVVDCSVGDDAAATRTTAQQSGSVQVYYLASDNPGVKHPQHVMPGRYRVTIEQLAPNGLPWRDGGSNLDA